MEIDGFGSCKSHVTIRSRWMTIITNSNTNHKKATKSHILSRALGGFFFANVIASAYFFYYKFVIISFY